MKATKLVRNFKVGDHVTYTYGTPRPCEVVGYANRTPFDPRANYKLKVDGRVFTANEHWLKKATT